MPITGTQKNKLTRKDFLHLREQRQMCVRNGFILFCDRGFYAPVKM